MNARRFGFCVTLVVCVAVGASGCFVGPASDLVSGGLKVLNGQISTLTSGEVRVLSETATSVINSETGSSVDPVTETQAQAIVDFFQANQIETLADVEQLSQQVAQDPSQIQGLDALAQAFQGTNTTIDPNDVDSQELEDIFDSVFAGTGP